MVKRPSPGPETGDLLNLPLGNMPDPGASPEPLAAQDFLPFDADDDELPIDSVEAEPPMEQPASLGGRLKAGLLDLAAIAGALVLAVVGSSALGIQPTIGQIPAFLVFAVSFSFLYTIVPLTFWGQTPGMAVASLVARGTNSAPLTIQQSMKRWLGGLMTVALLGLPVLLALVGGSLADRLSSSSVRHRPD